MEGLTRSHGTEGASLLLQQSSPEGQSLQVPSEGSGEADAQGAGGGWWRRGEQGSDGMPRPARMVEPAERKGRKEGGT